MRAQVKKRNIRQKYEALKNILESSNKRSKRIHDQFLKSVLQRLQTELTELETQISTEKKNERQRKVFKNDDNVTAADHFQKLPEEVVEMIFGHLENSEDVKNCSRTCKFFERILIPTKAVWLFHEVLPHLVKIDYVDDFMDLGDPTGILKLRQPCHEWKLRMDELFDTCCLEGVTYSQSYKTAVQQYRIRGAVDSVEHFSPTMFNEFKEFNETFGNRPLSCSNPFIGRRLTLNAGEDDWDLDADDDLDAPLIRDYWREAEKFLEVWGMHLWTCSLKMDTLKLHQLLPTIRTFCKHIPNVKKLSLFGVEDNWKKVDAHRKEIVKMKRSLQRNPFPSLSHLISLEVCGLPHIFYKLIFPLICGQLHQLKIQQDVDFVLEANELNCNLPNLTSLEVSCEPKDAPILLKLNCLALTHLIIHKLEETQEMFAVLFQILNKFSPTLRELYIGGTNTLPGDRAPARKPFVGTQHLHFIENDFPHLQMLHLKGWSESFDILLRMPYLQYLEVRWMDNSGQKLFSRVQKRECVEIHGFIERLYESNIWILLPHLSFVRFYFCNPGVDSDTSFVYTREGYVYKLRQN